MESITKFYCDPLFGRTLGDLRAKGGYAAVAAGKAEELIALLSGRPGSRREKFRFTRRGEYRIRNCRKVDLGCGYRIVCIQKDGRLVLVYIGTHDDCFRWIERHRTAEYDPDRVPEKAWTEAASDRAGTLAPEHGGTDEDRFAEAYEEALKARIDDAMLRRVFSGLIVRGTESA